VLLVCVAVAGCASTGVPAPIIDRSPKKAPIVEAAAPAAPKPSAKPAQQPSPAALDSRAPTSVSAGSQTSATNPPAAASPTAAATLPRSTPTTPAAASSPPGATPTTPASGTSTSATSSTGKTPATAAPGISPVQPRPQAGDGPLQPAATAAPTAAVATARRAPAASEEPAIRPYREGDWRPEFYIVKKGDTLYSIALDHGQDYRDLALWNNLADPAYIQVDQRLRLFPPGSSAEITTPEPIALPPATLPAKAAEPVAVAVPTLSEPKGKRMPYSEQALAELTRYGAGSQRRSAAAPTATTAPSAATAAAAPRPPAAPRSVQAGMSALPDERLVWEWPTAGRVIYGFGEGTNYKGVGIDGAIGQAVVASAPGKVVYSGSGLRGYGKLIIIKHNATYLSVYSHNSQLLVREGQAVAQGQKIAEMGDSDSDRVALHFEIRRLGKPVDPLKHLPEKTS
jgi:lipoprotein NlpD